MKIDEIKDMLPQKPERLETVAELNFYLAKRSYPNTPHGVSIHQEK